MDKSELITATEASRSFSELLHRVCYGGESFVIKKGNRLMARITPVDVASQKPVKTTEPAVAVAETTLADGLTQEEADYYKTVVEQLNKMVPEPCE